MSGTDDPAPGMAAVGAPEPAQAPDAAPAPLESPASVEAVQVAPKSPAVPIASPQAERIAAVVRGWVMDRLHNSPVARDTAAFNHLTDSLPELERRILEEIA